MTRGDEPAWIRDAVWWQVYPLGFTGADPTGASRALAGGLDQVTGWLDYLLELGANGLALGPLFASGSHGYDTVDHYAIDDRLGDRAAFDRLIAAAHERGIRVMLDGVFNHVGRGFAAVTAAERDPGSAEAGWLRRGRDGRWKTFEGHDALVALDHSSPAVADHVASVMTHWLDAGADAWRLDAAYAVPAAFWAEVLPRVRAAHPEVYVLGEVLHGDYAGYVDASSLDTLTQYELWKAVWSALASANFFELDWSLTRHNAFLDTFVPLTFIGNHDVTRIAGQVGDPRHRPHALVLLATLAGTPSVYYGDEIGLEAVKEERAGGDDAIRPAYPSSPEELLGDLDDTGARTRRLHQELIGLRRRHAWLHDARSETVLLANRQLVYRMRARAGSQSLVVALNLDDAPLRFDGGELLAGDATPAGDGAWTAPAHGWSVCG